MWDILNHSTINVIHIHVHVPLYKCTIICTCPIHYYRINSVSTGQIMGDTYTEGCLGRRGKWVWSINIY